MESAPPAAFTEEAVAQGPVGIISPINVQFAETDRKLVTFLYPDASGARQLYAIDTAADSDFEPFLLLDSTKGSSAELSLVEQLQRERMRLFGGGLASYQWAERSSDDSHRRALAPINGQFLLYDSPRGATPESLMLVDPMKDVPGITSPALVDPHISPSGLKVAFVCQGDLYVVNTPADVSDPKQLPKAQRLTVNGEKPGVTCGLADYVAQEEMNRYRGFWWSPDSSLIAYAEVDESHVPEYEIRHQGKSDPHHTESHRYPFAGAANPSVKLAVLRADGSGGMPQSVWMDLVGSDPSLDASDYYVARVGWWPDGSCMAQVQDRDQSVLQLLRLDPSTGERTGGSRSYLSRRYYLRCPPLTCFCRADSPPGREVERVDQHPRHAPLPACGMGAPWCACSARVLLPVGFGAQRLRPAVSVQLLSGRLTGGVSARRRTRRSRGGLGGRQHRRRRRGARSRVLQRQPRRPLAETPLRQLHPQRCPRCNFYPADGAGRMAHRRRLCAAGGRR